MFGYVKVYKPELKVCEFDTYKAVYCSVCKNLGKNYGHIMRMSLSYDFAFLAMLGLCVKKTQCAFKKSHCVYNPFKHCWYNADNDDVFDFCSAAAVIMMYYKLTDDVRDASFIKGLPCRALRAIIRRRFKKASRLYPQILRAVSTLDTDQIQSEIKRDGSLDTSAEPTAKALSAVCGLLANNDEQKRILEQIGYCTGKWVYIADALDDAESDMKSGLYNPVTMRDQNDVIGTLNVCSTQAGRAFELLNQNCYGNIMKNIFYLGMPNEIKRIVKQKGDVDNERSL